MPPMALTMAGAPGAVAAGEGVTPAEGDDGELVPTILVAVTVKVYTVPLARPVTTSGLPAPVAENPPGADVTV